MPICRQVCTRMSHAGEHVKSILTRFVVTVPEAVFAAEKIAEMNERDQILGGRRRFDVVVDTAAQ